MANEAESESDILFPYTSLSFLPGLDPRSCPPSVGVAHDLEKEEEVEGDFSEWKEVHLTSPLDPGRWGWASQGSPPLRDKFCRGPR